ncbi:MAG: hypothetical protein JXA57_07115, partial [Armatimonadetes bacterium]|nr:hypothetical protein [Armatimonadota bacterium]
NEASALRLQGMGVEAAAKRTYLEALGPYREACRKAGVACEFDGARAANKAPTVHFLVEKVSGGIKVAIKGRPETEQVIAKKTLYVARCRYVGSLSSSAGQSRMAA